MPDAPTTTDRTAEPDAVDETTVVVVTTTTAPPVQVWDVLVHRTPEWWGEAYLGPGGGSMTLEPVLGGRLHVGDSPDTGALHGTVRAFDPTERLEIGGVLVPGAYAGTITVTVEPTNLGTQLRVTHTARGRIEADVEDRISDGWHQLVEALVALAES